VIVGITGDDRPITRVIVGIARDDRPIARVIVRIAGDDLPITGAIVAIARATPGLRRVTMAPMGVGAAAAKWVLVAMLLAVAWLLPASAFAAPLVVVDAEAMHVPLAPYLDVFEDTTATLGLDDVKRPEVAARFEAYRGSSPNFGFTRSAYWLRFDAENASDAPVERWLTVSFPAVEHLEVFREGEPPAIQGSLHPRAERELPRRGYTFRIALAPHERHAVYVRAWGESELQLPIELWARSALEADDRVFTSWAALAFGLMLALALYNLILFLFVREPAHLYYAGAVVSAALWITCLDDTMSELLPASIPWTPHAVNVVTAYGWLILATLFARSFLQLDQTHPRIARGLLGYAGLVATVGGLYLAGGLDYRVQNTFGSLLALLCGLASVTIAVLRWREGQVAARYFVLGWSVLVVNGALGIAAVHGLVPLRLGLIPHIGWSLEAIILSFALADAARRRNEHVAALQRASARFVPFELLALLGKRELPEVKQGDQVERAMTTFFLDVRSFTSLVEKMTPEQTIAFVNAVFSKMEAPIAKHRGVIDKFMGDGVMALFERADDAVAASVACLGALDAFNAERETRGEPRLAVGIGLHTGPLMVGTVGGDERLSCTVIGDSVNLGSRIEGMTKTFGASILMTDATHAALARPDAFEVRRLGRVAAKGKARAVGLYEVLDGLPPEERARKLATRAQFETAVDAFIAADVAAARTGFEGWPQDRAATLYLDLCVRADDAARASWDGAVRLDAK
jgi:class 3 adenylate cyclase